MRVVLVEPEIPQNTGSVARLCAATDTPLDLVGKLGFSLEDRYLKRAGLDYWPFVKLAVHPTWEEFRATRPPGRTAGSGAAARPQGRSRATRATRTRHPRRSARPSARPRTSARSCP